VTDPRSRPHGQTSAQLEGRYWPTRRIIDPPRLPDGTIDIRALCTLYDNAVNNTHPTGDTP
jgi:hypothetical protein